MKETFIRRVLRLPQQTWRHWVGVAGIMFATIFAVSTEVERAGRL